MKKSAIGVWCCVFVGGVWSSAQGAALPDAKKVCVTSTISSRPVTVVARKQLAITIFEGDAPTVYANDPDNDLWRTIFLGNCTPAEICPAGTEKQQACVDLVNACPKILTRGAAFFLALRDTRKAPYTPAPGLANQSPQAALVSYFTLKTDTASNYIACSPPAPGAPTVATNPTANPSAYSPFRLRGTSDDLYIDRLLQADVFKSTSQATVTFTGDNSATATHTAKFIGAFGYAYRYDDVNSATQIIPYVSFNQSFTDTQFKPRTIAASNFVASGVLFSTNFPDPNLPDLVHVVTARPQYLKNTADQSEFASLRAVWAPWTSAGTGPFGFDINSARVINGLPWPTWGRLLFDVRNDYGDYANRGNNPALFAQYRSFERIGTHAGFSLTTEKMPSLTLTIAETYMYGAMGSVRDLNLSEASLTDNINEFVGVTAKFSSGRDLETALPTRTWTIGLTARY